ncbi:MAG: alpha/beta hydrolase [Cyanobacteriota/Melainabacteria group bacterium]
MQFEKISTNGVSLHTALAGPEDGPLVILLHGFPEAWFCWRHQIEYLAAQGYRVAVPDQRGYNLSDKPEGVEAYKLSILAQDILGLADALGHEQFYLAGHDWGAAVAWYLGIEHPQRLKALSILNVPHPQIFRRHLKSSFKQRMRSWYILFFQLPVVPEALFKAFNSKIVLQNMQHLDDEEKEQYLAAWSDPKAITGMLNWYRAIVRHPPSLPRPATVNVPTLVIWGKQDRYLSVRMAQPSADMCKDGRLVILDNATHWVTQDEPEKVGALLLEHFRKNQQR